MVAISGIPLSIPTLPLDGAGKSETNASAMPLPQNEQFNSAVQGSSSTTSGSILKQLVTLFDRFLAFMASLLTTFQEQPQVINTPSKAEPTSASALPSSATSINTVPPQDAINATKLDSTDQSAAAVRENSSSIARSAQSPSSLQANNQVAPESKVASSNLQGTTTDAIKNTLLELFKSFATQIKEKFGVDLDINKFFPALTENSKNTDDAKAAKEKLRSESRASRMRSRMRAFMKKMRLRLKEAQND